MSGKTCYSISSGLFRVIGDSRKAGIVLNEIYRLLNHFGGSLTLTSEIFPVVQRPLIDIFDRSGELLVRTRRMRPMGLT